MPFRGSDYIVQKGTEGVANLVFTVPKSARGVRKGDLTVEGDDESYELESLFHIQCILGITIGMGVGSKDVVVELPITVVHPAALRAFGLSDIRPASPALVPYAVALVLPPAVSARPHTAPAVPVADSSRIH